MATANVILSVSQGSGSGTYAGGSRVSISAYAPATGNVFDGWTTTRCSVGNSGQMNTYVDLPNPTSTITASAVAHYTYAYYTYTYSAGSNGYIDGDAVQSVRYGLSTDDVTAVGNLGYEFDRWNDGNTNATRSDTVTSGGGKTAYFVQTGTQYTSSPVAANTPAGALLKIFYRSLAASMTPDSILDKLKLFPTGCAGADTPTGALIVELYHNITYTQLLDASVESDGGYLRDIARALEGKSHSLGIISAMPVARIRLHARRR